jgi:hypothetical protein
MENIDRKFRFIALNPVNGKVYTENDAIILCAKDAAVLPALEAYRAACIDLGANREHILSIELLYNRVLNFQADQGGGRVPDTVGEEIKRCLGTDAPVMAGFFDKGFFAKKAAGWPSEKETYPSPEPGKALGASAPVDEDMVKDAQRYRRLRILGCAPAESQHLNNGFVLRFTNLDEAVDADIRFINRGDWNGKEDEARPKPKEEAVKATLLPGNDYVSMVVGANLIELPLDDAILVYRGLGSLLEELFKLGPE